MSSRVLTGSLLRHCLPRALRIHRSSAPWHKRLLSVSFPTQSTPPPFTASSSIPIARYHKLSDATMDRMLESLEVLIDSLGCPEYEVEYSSGVLTLNMGANGIYVINKQPPNKQIWLSSPLSGPKRYDYDEEKDGWYYSRDGRSISTLLEEELSQALGQKIELHLENVSKSTE